MTDKFWACGIDPLDKQPYVERVEGQMGKWYLHGEFSERAQRMFPGIGIHDDFLEKTRLQAIKKQLTKWRRTLVELQENVRNITKTIQNLEDLRDANKTNYRKVLPRPVV